ncbi:MAG: D-cysteine desulfhydrase [Alphaproteobacteria bacterium]|nr:D-cysteine desulfhydrase [Alphaproteobacteria bacterium]
MLASLFIRKERNILGVLEKFSRVALCHQPTPLERMPRLSKSLNRPNLWIKRDDCTGLATGGNKTRKLEFLMAAALDAGADMIVTQGAIQSNHVRQTAAASCKLGLECHALLERRVPDRDENYETTGNVFLDNLFGTSIEYRPAGLDMNEEAIKVAEKFKQAGRKPYFIPGGGSNEIGALGYVACAEELIQQMDEQGLNPKWIVFGTGSTGTQAGLVAGFHALGCNVPIMGISVRKPQQVQIDNVFALAQKTAALICDKPLTDKGKILVDDNYVGPGYGIPTNATIEACELIARQEGILLDLVYAGKGLAGLIGLIKQGKLGDDGDVVFIHTGGSVSLFAYEDQFKSI